MCGGVLSAGGERVFAGSGRLLAGGKGLYAGRGPERGLLLVVAVC